MQQQFGSFVNACLATQWRSRFSLFLAGVIYPLAFAPFEFWPAAFISIIFLLACLMRPSKMSAFKKAYYWGVGCFLIGASWVYVSIHEFGYVPMLGAAALTLIFVAFLALFKGFFGWCCHRLLSLSNKHLAILVFPLVWLISEFIQSSILNGFPWLLTGYSQIDSPLYAIASWLGVYGVSWFVLAFCSLAVLMLDSKNIKPYVAVAAILISIPLLAAVHYNSLSNSNQESKQIEVGLVQPNILQEQKWDRQFFAKIIDILYQETESLWGKDLIIWPEGAIPAYEHQVFDITDDLTKQAEKFNSQLILGIPVYDQNSAKSYVALNSYGEKRHSYHKQVLVPFGEYVPLEDMLRGLIKFLDLPMSGFSPAKTSQSPMVFDEFSVVPAICYEIAYPEIVRKLAAQSSNSMIIVTVSNEAWFGDSFGPYQHMQMARMRSLELGVPLIRSTNDGITAVVNAKGDIEKIMPRYQQGSLSATVSLANFPTLYRELGPIALFLILAVSTLLIVVVIILNKQKNT
ncbi:MAG: apolipoprotein N-acyltransferase [Kangiellaceae bacterium]|nr:apolipoprotein N-acyltransferase [Kangiellaceae bacterium]MCW8999690.1 apolipoprotein N-acyltransferase [Kangiellaceae bacterium]